MDNCIFLVENRHIPQALEKLFGAETLHRLLADPKLRLDPDVTQAIRDAAVPAKYTSLPEVCKADKDALYKVTDLGESWKYFVYGWTWRRVGSVVLTPVDTSKLWTVRMVDDCERLFYFNQPDEDNFLRGVD